MGFPILERELLFANNITVDSVHQLVQALLGTLVQLKVIRGRVVKLNCQLLLKFLRVNYRNNGDVMTESPRDGDRASTPVHLDHLNNITLKILKWESRKHRLGQQRQTTEGEMRGVTES